MEKEMRLSPDYMVIGECSDPELIPLIIAAGQKKRHTKVSFLCSDEALSELKSKTSNSLKD